MSYERIIGKTPEYVNQSTLEAAVSFMRQLPYGAHTIPTSPELTKLVSNSVATPFQAIESLSISHTAAEFDPIDNTLYPDTVALHIHGWYGDIDANERFFIITLSDATTDQSAHGFVTQSFHDSESYRLSSDSTIYPSDYARTLAGHYSELLQATSPVSMAIGTSSDYKRTAEFRPLDEDDLRALLGAYDATLN